MTDLPELPALEQRLRAARRTGDPVGIATVQADLGFRHALNGSVELSVAAFLASAQTLADHDRVRAAADSLTQLAQMFGQVPAAKRRLLERAAVHARRCDPVAAANCFLNIAAAHDASQQLSRLDDVIPARGEALRFARLAGDDGYIALALTYAAKTEMDLLGAPEARRLCERAAPYLRGARGHLRERELRAIWHGTYGHALCGSQPDLARRHMHAALRLYAALGSEDNAERMRRNLSATGEPSVSARVEPILAVYRARMLAEVAEFDAAFDGFLAVGRSAPEEVVWGFWADQLREIVARVTGDVERWAQLARTARAATAGMGLPVRTRVAQAALRAFDAAASYDESLEVMTWLHEHVSPTIADPERQRAYRVSNLIERGGILENLNRPEDALEAYMQARAQLDDDSDPVLRARVCHGLASVHEDTGRLPDAEALYREAIARSAPLDDAGGWHERSLHNLGNVLADLGRLWEALGAYERSEALARAHGDLSGAASALLSRATVLSDLGREAQAAELYRQVYAQVHAGEDRRIAASACASLAAVPGEDAVVWLERSRDLWASVRRNLEVGRIEERLAREYGRRGREDDARAAVKRAVTIAAATGDPYGEASARLATAAQLRDDQDGRAEAELAEALRLARRVQQPDLLLRALTTQAKWALADGDLDAAAAASEEAASLYEVARSYRLHATDRESIADAYGALLRLRVGILLAQAGRASVAEADELRQRAFSAAIAARPRAHLDRLKHGANDAVGELEATIRAANARAFYLRSLDATPERAAELAELQRRIVEAERRRDDALGRAAQTLGRYRSAPGIGADEARALFDADGCMVFYAFDDQYVHVFVLTPTELRATTLRAGPPAPERLVALRFDLRDATVPWPSQHAAWVYQAFVAPAEQLLGGRLPPRVVVSPDGWLSLVSFAALIADGELLGERYELTMCPSPAATLARRPSAAAPRGTVLALGDPLAEEVRRIPATAAEVSRIVKVLAADAPEPVDADAIDPPSLHWTSAGGECVLRTGVHATKAALLGHLRERSYRWLHLATHAVNDVHASRLSGILLSASADEPAPYLTSEEVEEQPLDCELCVLSACESAGGRVSPAEGVIGLARAFAIAGADAVCASLWPVDDRATASLMEHVYVQLRAGRAPAAALAAAQANMRDAHPAHWAGFVIIR